MKDLSIWIAVTLVWLATFLAILLVLTRLSSFLLICLLDVAMTIGVLAGAAFLRSLAPDQHQSNLEILQIWFMIGVLVFSIFACQLILQTTGVAL